MNEFGKPNKGIPSVRFDEGRNGSAGLTTALSSKPPHSTSPTLPNQPQPIPQSNTPPANCELTAPEKREGIPENRDIAI
jgi:hypothetical protein